MDKQKLLVVLHESNIPEPNLLTVIQSKYNEVYYHSVINREGTIIYCVEATKRIEASYPSSFNGESINGSVDDFAYHICLVSPDVDVDLIEHEGYTIDQYISLAWLCKQLDVEEERIVTHKEIDLSNTRIDPRSFNKEKLIELLSKVNKQKTIIWEQ